MIGHTCIVLFIAILAAVVPRAVGGAPVDGMDETDFLQIEVMNPSPYEVLGQLQAWQEQRQDGRADAAALRALAFFLERAGTVDAKQGGGLDVPAGERAQYDQCARLIVDGLYTMSTPELRAAVLEALADSHPLRREAGLMAAAAVADHPSVHQRLAELAGAEDTPRERLEAVLALLALGESRERAALEACRVRADAAGHPAVREAAALAAHRVSVARGETRVPPIDVTAPVGGLVALGMDLGSGFLLPAAAEGDGNVTAVAWRVTTHTFQDSTAAAFSRVLSTGGTVLVVSPTAGTWPPALAAWAAENGVTLPVETGPTSGEGMVNHADYRAFGDFPYELREEQGDAATACWTRWSTNQAAPVLSRDRTGALVVVQDQVLGRGRLVFTTVDLQQKQVYAQNILRWIYGDSLLARPALYQHPRYGMDADMTTPHRAWAPSWASGPLRVLWISDEPYKRGLIEVRQRVSLDWRFAPYDAFPVSTTAWLKKDAMGPSLMGQRAVALVEESLPDTDAVVMDSGRMNLLWARTLVYDQTTLLGFDTLPRHLRRRIARRIREGMGLVILTAEKTTAPEGSSSTAAHAELSALLGPMLPFTPARDLQAAIQVSTTGKGRQLRLGLNLPHLALLSSTPSGHLPAALKAPGVLRDLLLINPNEYTYAAVGKALHWAARKAGGPAITGLTVRDAGSGQPAALTLTLSAPYHGHVECSLRNRYNEPIELAPCPVDSAALNTPLPAALPDGAYVVETVLKDAEGRTVDFAATWTQVAMPVAITNVTTDRPFYRAGETIRLTVDLSPGSEGELSLDVRDTYGRLVHRAAQTVNSGQRQIPLAIPVVNPLTRLWDADVTVRMQGSVTAHYRRPIGIALPAPERDYEVEADLPAAPLERVFRERLGVTRVIGDPDTGLRHNFNFSSGSWWQSLGGMTTPGVGGKPNERVPCFSDPSFRLRVIRDMQARGPLYASLGIQSYMIGDEVQLGAACRCEHSMYQFRRWLKARYPDLAALNKEWGSSFASWDDVHPLDGNDPQRPAPQVNQRQFQMWEFSEYCNFMEIFGGDYMPGFTAGQSGGESGNTLLELSGLLFYYDVIERVPAVIRRRDAVIGSWFRPGYTFRETHEAMCRHWPWWHCFRGTTRMCLWYTAPGGSPAIHGDLRPFQAFVWLGEEMRELHGGGLGRLLLNARRDEGRCAVYASQRSGFIRGVVKSLGGAAAGPIGDPAPAFLRRQTECRAISEYQVERGDMEARGLRLVCLPGVVSLSESERAALRAFVGGGGVLVADYAAGLRNEHGTWVGDDFTRELFGAAIAVETVRTNAPAVTFAAAAPDAPLPALRRLQPLAVSGAGATLELADGTALAATADGSPAFVVKKTGAGTALLLNVPFPTPAQATNAFAQALVSDLAALAGVEPSVAMKATAGPLPRIDFGVFRDGDAFYAGLASPGDGGPIVSESTTELEVNFQEKRHLYDARQGVWLGETRTASLTLTPGIAVVYAGLPARLTGLRVEPNRPTYRRGETIALRIATEAEAAVTWRQVLSVRAARPDGTAEPAYARTIVVEGGRADLCLPLALDAAEGDWTLTLRDAATGVSGQCRMGVRE